ncbi:unnamed protein product [Prorocentrum cordatum]|uniref:Uncharacterized protein n=1 Tax=Prorocentrum cordatum TaxID=2364126 RepID=A0ABN9SQY7_9DINO|nr:unnamed protein product [Polarella glacialis]
MAGDHDRKEKNDSDIKTPAKGEARTPTRHARDRAPILSADGMSDVSPRSSVPATPRHRPGGRAAGSRASRDGAEAAGTLGQSSHRSRKKRGGLPPGGSQEERARFFAAAAALRASDFLELDAAPAFPSQELACAEEPHGAAAAAGGSLAAAPVGPLQWPLHPSSGSGGARHHLAGRWRGGGPAGDGATRVLGAAAASSIGSGGLGGPRLDPWAGSLPHSELDVSKNQLLDEVHGTVKEVADSIVRRRPHGVIEPLLNKFGETLQRRFAASGRRMQSLDQRCDANGRFRVQLEERTATLGKELDLAKAAPRATGLAPQTLGSSRRLRGRTWLGPRWKLRFGIGRQGPATPWASTSTSRVGRWRRYALTVF